MAILRFALCAVALTATALLVIGLNRPTMTPRTRASELNRVSLKTQPKSFQPILVPVDLQPVPANSPLPLSTSNVTLNELVPETVPIVQQALIDMPQPKRAETAMAEAAAPPQISTNDRISIFPTCLKQNCECQNLAATQCDSTIVSSSQTVESREARPLRRLLSRIVRR